MEIQRPPARQTLPTNAKLVFKGEVFDVYQWAQALYDGSVATYELLKRPDTVSVIPILPSGEILLVDEQQSGARRAIDIPMGRAEANEAALTTAKRELLEETGYEATEWILFDAHQPIGKIDWAVFIFIAKGLTKVAEQNLDPGEKIQLYPVSLETFKGLVLKNEIGGPHLVRAVLEANSDPHKAEEFEALFTL